MKRIGYLDIARGLLMIATVLGHSKYENAYLIYWFHMPAFFIISGMIVRREESATVLREKTARRFVRLAIPYVVFYLCTNMLMYTIGRDKSVLQVLELFWKGLYGGRAALGVYWFITCLFMGEWALKYMLVRFKTPAVAGMLVLFWSLSHLQAAWAVGKDVKHLPWWEQVPWNLDVCLLAIVYIAIGYYGRDLIQWIMTKKRFMIPAAALGVTLMWLSEQGTFDYHLNMKFLVYRHPFLDLLIPTIFTMLVLAAAKMIEASRFRRPLDYIGRNTIIIMYLHIPIRFLLIKYYGVHWELNFILGLLLPLAFDYAVSRHPVGRALFKGELPSTGRRSRLSYET